MKGLSKGRYDETFAGEDDDKGADQTAKMCRLIYAPVVCNQQSA